MVGTKLYPVYATTTVIRPIIHGKGKQPTYMGNATGTFFKHGNAGYLVTNRHVVIDETDRYYPDAIEICVHIDTTNLTQNRKIVLPLYNGDKPTWMEHPRKDWEVDLAVLETDQLLPQEAEILQWDKERLLEANLQLPVAAHLAAIGYPMDFYDRVNNLPVVRLAGLASAYGVFFQEKPFFLIDANLQEGMSGSPVITSVPRVLMTKDFGFSMDAKPPALLGINSGEFPDPRITTMLGLHKVWYASLIVEIIEQ